MGGNGKGGGVGRDYDEMRGGVCGDVRRGKWRRYKTGKVAEMKGKVAEISYL
jgi:hypothetical protein